MRPRLVALDLDGTLLPRSKVLPERNRAAVAAAREAGAVVTLATGKTFHLTGRYADALGIAGPLIALDGSEVREWPTGEEISVRGIPGARVRAALGAVGGLDLHPFLADAGDRLLLVDAIASWRDFLRVYSERIDLTADPAADWIGEPRFLGFLGPAGAVREGERALAAALDGELRVFTADLPRWTISLLVVRPWEDKGAALAALAGRLGIDREEVVAVGDWKNDVSMIEWAGTGVAMANAHPDAVAVADVVLPGDSDSGALADWLQSTTVS